MDTIGDLGGQMFLRNPSSGQWVDEKGGGALVGAVGALGPEIIGVARHAPAAQAPPVGHPAIRCGAVGARKGGGAQRCRVLWGKSNQQNLWAEIMNTKAGGKQNLIKNCVLPLALE